MSRDLSETFVEGRLPYSTPSVVHASEPCFLPSTTTPLGILTVTLHEIIGLVVPDEGHTPWLDVVLGYEKSQVSVSMASAWFRAIHKFHVTRASDFTIRLYSKDLEGSKTQYGFMGLTTLRLFQDTPIPESQWLDMRDGAIKIHISLEFTSVESREFDRDDERCGTLGEWDKLLLVQEKETQQKYARKTIGAAEEFQLSDAATDIYHPFIAPLVSSSQLMDRVRLYAPYVSGGHLFNHLQRVRHFNTDRSRFYIAEIVCALEYLHNTFDIKASLKPSNVLLDAVGHITLCSFGIFGDHNKRKRPEYPAPESLVEEANPSKAEDWWTLGTFLYEMLTGTPVFCDDNRDAMRRNILEQPIHFPSSMDPLALDLLTKLLDRRPEKRLGTGGAAEVKAHAFFQDIDWESLLEKKCDPSFRPGQFAEWFSDYGVDNHEKPCLTLKEQFAEWCPEGHMETPEPVESVEPEREAETSRDQPLINSHDEIVQTDDWELLWVEATGDFCFHNRITRAKRLIYAPAISAHWRTLVERVAESTISNVPSPYQKRKALEEALEAGHFNIVSQLLFYGMNLDIEITVSRTRTTPYEWAVRNNNPKVLSMFLAHGIDRVVGTRALGLAVDRRNVSIAKVLLAHGVQCDFKETDRPHPLLPGGSCTFGMDISKPEEYTPPLVRAIKKRNIELLQLLLANGAGVNVGYHDVSWTFEERDYFGFDWLDHTIEFRCGRPVQLAMELGELEMVKLLLDGGADIDLAQPVWDAPGHHCRFLKREEYLKVYVGLRRLSGQGKMQQTLPA